MQFQSAVCFPQSSSPQLPLTKERQMICETILSILIEHLQHRGTYMHLHWARHLPNSAHKGLLKTLSTAEDLNTLLFLPKGLKEKIYNSYLYYKKIYAIETKCTS